MDSLISIIIPTYNRAHLLGETLESILDQTYPNWECIVVDDGSLDYTKELMEFYCDKDCRMKFYERPIDRPKGANACRNYGLEMSKGEFINWFDSDDLMKDENLDLKMTAFDEETDMVIGNSLNFDEQGNLSRPFPLNYEAAPTAENFIGGVIGWITNDALIRRSVVTIKFNESLQSGQEYNFFSRLLYETTRVKYIRKDVAKRRVHLISIQQKLRKKPEHEKYEQLLINELALFRDIRSKASDQIKRRAVRRLARFSYLSASKFTLKRHQIDISFILFRTSFYRHMFYYGVWTISNFCMGKGYYFIRKIDL